MFNDVHTLQFSCVCSDTCFFVFLLASHWWSETSWYHHDMVMIWLWYDHGDSCRSLQYIHDSLLTSLWWLRKSFSAIRNVSDAMEPRQVPITEMFQGNIYSIDNSILVGRKICYLMLFVLWRCSLKAIHWVTVSRVPSRWAEKRASQDSFTTVAKDILSNNKDVVGLMAEGIQNLSQLHPELCDTTFVDNFLDQFLLNRIGSNVLLNQYLASMDKSLCNDR